MSVLQVPVLLVVFAGCPAGGSSDRDFDGTRISSNFFAFFNLLCESYRLCFVVVMYNVLYYRQTKRVTWKYPDLRQIFLQFGNPEK